MKETWVPIVYIRITYSTPFFGEYPKLPPYIKNPGRINQREWLMLGIFDSFSVPLRNVFVNKEVCFSN